MEFAPTAQSYIHFARQLVMSCGVGVKRHRDNSVSDQSFHAILGHGFFPRLLHCPTNAVGKVQLCP